MRVLMILLRRSAGGLILVSLMGIISGGTVVGLLAVINRVLREGTYSAAVVALFVGLCVARLVSSIVGHLLIVRVSAGATYDMSLHLVRRIVQAPLRTLEEIGAPRLLAVFSNDIGAFANVVISLPYLIVNVIIVVGCMVYIGLCSWQICLGVLLFAVFAVLSFSLPIMLARRCFLAGREETDTLYKHFRSVVEGVKELKLHRARRHTFVQDVVASTALRMKKHMVKGIIIYAVASHWNRLLFFVYVGVLVFAVPHFTQVTPAELGGYVLVLLYMMAPLEAIQNALPGIAQADVAMKKLEGLGLSLSAETSNAEACNPGNAPSMGVAVRLDSVVYAYGGAEDEKRFTLGPISFTLNRGELVFLIGGNGSGKTTLVKLLVGLYPPDAGTIYLDDASISDHNREQYREHFAVVFQDFWLFESLLGLEKNPRLDGDVDRQLRMLQLQDKVTVENGVLSTLELSRGQRKRLAILTAFLEDRPFYIFDEWAADQDPLYKQVFYEEILPRLKSRGKAVLVITHDDRYWHLADRLVKLESGKVSTLNEGLGRYPPVQPAVPTQMVGDMPVRSPRG